MPGPAPKPASQRQRRNKTATAAHLEAASAARVELPPFRVSSLMCGSCPEPSWHHTKAWWMKAEREERDVADPHDFEPRILEWRAATRKWWETIWASPMAAEWVDADVPGLLALAVLIDDFWTAPDSKVHGEIRQASREFGLSPLSRRQLQWEVHRVESATRPKANPVPAPRQVSDPRAALRVIPG